ncbi:hypothetical protein [Georgenia sp. MJ170]
MAAATLVAGLTLAGCSGNPGAAAVVDGNEVTESQLAEAVADFAAITGQPVEPTAMLGTLVVGPIIFDVAQEYGVAASDEESAALLDQQIVASGTPLFEEPYSGGVLDVARIAIVNQTLMASPAGAEAQAAIGERIATADVEVSSRYGEFDPRGTVVPTQFDWIAAPPAPELEDFQPVD